MNKQSELSLFRCVAYAASRATALMFTALPTAFATPAILACPPFIAEKSLQLKGTPAGWTTFVGTPLYLHGAAPMSSPPAMLGELMSDTEQRGKQGMVYTYRIDGKFPNGKWLACKYGESDQVMLAHPLPDDINVCRLTYRKGEHVGQNDIEIDCK